MQKNKGQDTQQAAAAELEDDDDLFSLDDEDDFFSQTRSTMVERKTTTAVDPFANFTDFSKGHPIEPPKKQVVDLNKSTGEMVGAQQSRFNKLSMSRQERPNMPKNAFYQEMQEQLNESSEEGDEDHDYFDGRFRREAQDFGSVYPSNETNPLAHSQTVVARGEKLVVPSPRHSLFNKEMFSLRGIQDTLTNNRKTVREILVPQKTKETLMTDGDLAALLVQDNNIDQEGNSKLFVDKICVIDNYFLKVKRQAEPDEFKVFKSDQATVGVNDVQQAKAEPEPPLVVKQQTMGQPPVRPQVQPVQPPTRPQVQPVQPPTRPQVQPVQPPARPQVQPVQPPVAKPQVQPVQPPVAKPQVQPVQPPKVQPVQPPPAKPVPVQPVQPPSEKQSVQPVQPTKIEPVKPSAQSEPAKLPPMIVESITQAENPKDLNVKQPEVIPEEPQPISATKKPTEELQTTQIETQIPQRTLPSPKVEQLVSPILVAEVKPAEQQEVTTEPETKQEPQAIIVQEFTLDDDTPHQSQLEFQEDDINFFSTSVLPQRRAALSLMKTKSRAEETQSSPPKASSPQRAESPSSPVRDASPKRVSSPKLPASPVRKVAEIMSEDEELFTNAPSDLKVLDKANYLRYISESANQKANLLEIVSKNERAYKQAAERLMEQHSQLALDTATVTRETTGDQPLLAATQLKGIAVVCYKPPFSLLPMCVATCEDFICVGFSEGSLRLFNYYQIELKHMTDKSTKNNAITCLDIQRLEKNQNLYVVCGHAKGHISLFEIVKGLQSRQDDMPQQEAKIEHKHRKTVDDVHKAGVIQVRFVGDLRKERVVASCDVDGKVCITTFIDSYVAYRTSTQIINGVRIGPAFSIKYCNHLLMKLQRAAPVQLEEKESLKDEMTRKLKDKLEKNEKVTLVGFGTLDQVVVCKVKPQVVPLISYRKPAFIKDGTVPYQDWGLALTPSHRDRAYPCLAIAWGAVLQLCVFTNEQEANSGAEQPMLQYDGYYITDCESIDQVLFLSESLVFVLVNRKDVKILYTQNFTPGCFNESYFSRDFDQSQQQQIDSPDAQQEFYRELRSKFAGSVSAYAEKDGGYALVEDEVVAFDNMPPGSSVQPTNNFNTSICRNQGFNIVCLGQNSVVLQSLIHWEDYIDIIKQTSQDNKLTLMSVLDIYNGKMVGLAGLPDQLNERQAMMSERIKELIKQNVNACIREYEKNQSVSQKTLSLTIEFCMRIGATDDIFGDLFDIFVFHGAEAMYFQGLHPFILSGKLKKIKLSEQLLQKLMDHYRKQDSQILEQVLVSVNMTRSSIIDEVRLLCEEEQLSSALIHIMNTILTSEEDKNTACLSILISLFNMMKKSGVTKTLREVQSLLEYQLRYPTSLFELSSQDAAAQQLQLSDEERAAQFRKARLEKVEIERSNTYIGYKILWLLTLFIEGCDYPQGSMDQLRWRYYIVDIVTFCTNEGFVQSFLELDPESFFSILKKLFNDPDPYKMISDQQDFLENNRNENPMLKPCADHSQILTIFDRFVAQVIDREKASNSGELTLKAETLQNAFVSFIMQIAKNKKIELPKQVCFTLIRDQINFYRAMLKIPKSELLATIPQTPATIAPATELHKPNRIYDHFVKKNERDIIAVFNSTTHFSREELNQLLQLAQETHLFKLTVLLNQLLGEYEICFILYFNNRAIRSDIFAWLAEFQHTLSSRAVNTDEAWEERQGIFAKMKELIGKKLFDFTRMDPVQTVRLVDFWFDRNYLQVADLLQGTKQNAFEFLAAILSENQEQIMADYSTCILQNKTSITNRYKLVLLRLCELVAEEKVRNKQLSLVELVSREYFPIDESIRICEKYNQEEACAVLYKRKGKLLQSVNLYAKLMQQLCIKSIIIHAVQEEHIGFQDPQCSSRSLKEFDRMLGQMIDICTRSAVKLPEPERTNLWMETIKKLFEIGREVEVAQMFKSNTIRERTQGKSQKKDETPDVPLKFEKFLLLRNQYFLAIMSEHVNLVSIIQVLESTGYNLKYDDFRRTFEEKIETDSYFMFILQAAISFTEKQQFSLRHDFYSEQSRGFLQNRKCCDGCGLELVSKFNDRELCYLKCGHIYHVWCCNKSDDGNRQCRKCQNELDIFRSYQQARVKQKQPQRIAAPHSPRSSGDNDTNTSTSDFDDYHMQLNNQSAASMAQTTLKKKQEKRVVQTRAMTEFDKLIAADVVSIKDFQI